MSWNEEFEFVAIGSGAAGLMGAAVAAELGARVAVLEAQPLLGGTTSFSGALLWAPGNRWQQAAGIADDRATARRYIERCLGHERAADPRWEVFLTEINPALDWLETHTDMRFELMHYPDSYGEWPEGRRTRHVASRPVSLRPLGEWVKKMRRPPHAGQDALTMLDIERAHAWLSPRALRNVVQLAPKVIGRRITKRIGMGAGLVAALLGYLLEQRVTIRTEHRVIALVREGGRVTGVKVATPQGERYIRARRGVLLACGGFDHDETLIRELLPGPAAGPQSPPVGRGDNIRLAREVGARLAALDEGWYLPGVMLPGASYEGRPLAVPMLTERYAPHTLWVNRAGERFVNESAQNAANAFYIRDAQGNLPNLPCYTIFDQQFRDRYHVFLTVAPKDPDPPGLVRADTLEALAARIHVDAAGLALTVARFNEMARSGRDTQFGRGMGAYDTYFGERRAAHPNLGAIEKPPFYAFEIVTGGVGTKGGALTNGDGCVIAQNGSVIEGLYAAGNACAAFNGPITVAGGCTIAPALVMGRQAARHAAARDLRADQQNALAIA
jgi:3-oxosteroid 1-dehydrogenase